ncbi:MAG TPA: hypothetical protein DCY48_01850 [Candidatus Magasanikbacteria bacterium]|nr:MAG: hypothetical protein A3I74_00760 [Candidatus Magasanikbacteria bacterium RIFCSPLOWO2_02_FULL_47_16]OGH80023.1 MAG: hypothetical protein A3C10_02465 [Candidatus Magasanikbacteria bacterium RIFCSPHIGHO2_02_FULL_48_18]HAZ28500.1 hypothetical protein [Candidatus Magasanikbacteria bacterium]
MLPIHQSLAGGRWQEFSLSEQLGNVGSEVHRAILFFKKNDMKRFASSLDRALELLDLTIGDSRWHGVRRQELTRARESFCSLFYDEHPYDTPERLDAYFTQFGFAARQNR